MHPNTKRLIKWLFKIGGLAVLLGAAAWFLLLYLTISRWDSPRTAGMALADLDGDGDLDAFLANGRSDQAEPNTVLWNEGDGNFHDSGQRLGQADSLAVVLYDVDDDGNVDAVVSNTSAAQFFWNDGHGNFDFHRAVWVPALRQTQTIGLWRYFPAKLNGDDRVDLFLAGCCGGGFSQDGDDWETVNAYNAVWLDEGESLPQNSQHKVQIFGNGSTRTVALADLDNDGDLDAFGANNFYLAEMGDAVTAANNVWFNDGHGVFTDSDQRLGNQRSYAIALGDVDGDHDKDAMVGNEGPDEVWWNDGKGNFSSSGQTLGNNSTRFLYLADLDEDGDLDAVSGDGCQGGSWLFRVFIEDTCAGRIWLNDGRGNYHDSGQQLRYGQEYAIAVGDVDGNGTVDVVAGGLDMALVWLNDGTGEMHQQ